ncbi:KTSC domain-containing protein [Daejeonella oryzae]|uniref:KTSC domain-containing protein n=1 Tax=Daejeonella oryzae TaxID=1122943 RepID=UPI0003FC7D56|nr:KTSC domain-containing protein [Daejeonella oryzae]
MPSSVISKFSYDQDSKSLIVTYVSGLVYRYKAVPLDIFNDFKSAESKGRYLNFHIKGKFSYEKLA